MDRTYRCGYGKQNIGLLVYSIGGTNDWGLPCILDRTIQLQIEWVNMVDVDIKNHFVGTT